MKRYFLKLILIVLFFNLLFEPLFCGENIKESIKKGKLFVEDYIDINKNINKRDIFLKAAELDSPEVINFLLTRYEGDILGSYREEVLRTFFVKVFLNDSWRVMEFSLKNVNLFFGKKMNLRDVCERLNKNLLLKALRYDAFKCAILILNESDVKDIVNLVKEDGRTPLIFLLEKEDVDGSLRDWLSCQLVLKGADPNREIGGVNPILLAIRHKKFFLFKFFMDHGGRKNYRFSSNKSLFYYAAVEGGMEYLEYMVKLKADVPDGLIENLYKEDKVYEVDFLIQNYGKCQKKFKWDKFFVQVSRGDEVVIKNLRKLNREELKDELKKVDAFGRRLIHIAFLHCGKELIEELIGIYKENELEISSLKDYRGNTPCDYCGKWRRNIFDNFCKERIFGGNKNE